MGRSVLLPSRILVLDERARTLSRIYLRVGPLHLPVFGLFAAAGLVCALWLSQRTARYAALSPERLWDAGMFALLAAFIASRALLIATDPKAFLRFPLLILTLPSLTYSGIAVTIVLTFVWLRIRHMPVMNVADAWAPLRGDSLGVSKPRTLRGRY